MAETTKRIDASQGQRRPNGRDGSVADLPVEVWPPAPEQQSVPRSAAGFACTRSDRR